MSGLERLLMSRMFRRYIESALVFWFPWVLLTELPAETIDGRRKGDNDTEF